jgi:hypothetical protein
VPRLQIPTTTALRMLPEPNEGCATRCFDDPEYFCLYCINSDGEMNSVGKYAGAEAWWIALQGEMASCGCGVPGVPSGEACGTIYTYIQGIYWWNLFWPCCEGNPSCSAPLTRIRVECDVKYDVGCPEGESCGNGNEWRNYNCVQGYLYVVNCTPCCGTCTAPDCGAQVCGGYSSCLYSEVAPGTIYKPKCVCSPAP